MANVNVNGRSVTYSDSGGDGHPVILGHGFFLDHTVFAAQAEALGERWRVIAWDARGHGGTADDGVPFTYWDQARDVLALMDALGVERATVGGVSQGGFIALRTALLAPDRVSALILSDTEAQACDPYDKVRYEGLFAALSERGPAEELIGPLGTQIIGDHPQAEIWRERWRSSPLPLGSPVDCLLGRVDVTARLPEITCPALLMWGSQDRSLPVERMEVLRDRLHDATPIHVISGAAHSPPLTHPHEVNRVMSDFLSALAPARLR
ncbi:alpha/beta fold hydrolase [Sinosporangium siamense]|uniref:2-succinyl-6-hydroxy-2, 4-cyclohexadiene-1-carboxy late synthase n=1 Tax=Sinosporangium siamense TaxID=1367973 RepID=A0A919VB27_9ACTN|nr:alpha/beta hydrolase [Sinosporangium siamense]GII96047.1 2-succinyl-6-hydroxy-2,4-cyclohexadiene-1-carboxy late synthase [Sinosporangium siamense]